MILVFYVIYKLLYEFKKKKKQSYCTRIKSCYPLEWQKQKK